VGLGAVAGSGSGFLPFRLHEHILCVAGQSTYISKSLSMKNLNVSSSLKKTSEAANFITASLAFNQSVIYPDS